MIYGSLIPPDWDKSGEARMAMPPAMLAKYRPVIEKPVEPEPVIEEGK